MLAVAESAVLAGKWQPVTTTLTSVCVVPADGATDRIFGGAFATMRSAPASFSSHVSGFTTSTS